MNNPISTRNVQPSTSTCSICHEVIEFIRPENRWRHTHSGDEECWTGDGSVADSVTMKWWEVIPVGSTLVGLSPSTGIAVFGSDELRWTVDLWTDEVLP